MTSSRRESPAKCALLLASVYGVMRSRDSSKSEAFEVSEIAGYERQSSPVAATALENVRRSQQRRRWIDREISQEGLKMKSSESRSTAWSNLPV